MAIHKIKPVGEIEYEKVKGSMNITTAVSLLENNYKNGDGDFIIRLPEMSPNGNPNHSILFGIRIFCNSFKELCLNSNFMLDKKFEFKVDDLIRADWELWRPIELCNKCEDLKENEE
jgi:hypothetical protein